MFLFITSMNFVPDGTSIKMFPCFVNQHEQKRLTLATRALARSVQPEIKYSFHLRDRLVVGSKLTSNPVKERLKFVSHRP